MVTYRRGLKSGTTGPRPPRQQQQGAQPSHMRVSRELVRMHRVVEQVCRRMADGTLTIADAVRTVAHKNSRRPPGYHVVDCGVMDTIFKRVMEEGIAANATVDGGVMGLCTAITFRSKSLDLVQYAVEVAKSDVNYKSHVLGALWIAVSFRLLGVVRYLLLNGANPSAKCTHATMYLGRPCSPLQLIVSKQFQGEANMVVGIIKCLIDAGAEIPSGDCLVFTPRGETIDECFFSALCYALEDVACNDRLRVEPILDHITDDQDKAISELNMFIYTGRDGTPYTEYNGRDATAALVAYVFTKGTRGSGWTQQLIDSNFNDVISFAVMTGNTPLLGLLHSQGRISIDDLWALIEGRQWGAARFLIDHCGIDLQQARDNGVVTVELADLAIAENGLTPLPTVDCMESNVVPVEMLVASREEIVSWTDTTAVRHRNTPDDMRYVVLCLARAGYFERVPDKLSACAAHIAWRVETAMFGMIDLDGMSLEQLERFSSATEDSIVMLVAELFPEGVLAAIDYFRRHPDREFSPVNSIPDENGYYLQEMDAGLLVNRLIRNAIDLYGSDFDTSRARVLDTLSPVRLAKFVPLDAMIADMHL